jgi:hypothetical protein
LFSVVIPLTLSGLVFRSETWSFGPLGDRFALPAWLLLPIWPLAVVAVVVGWHAITGRPPIGVPVLGGVLAVLGSVAVAAGAEPGLILLGLAIAGLSLWDQRGPDEADFAP